MDLAVNVDLHDGQRTVLPISRSGTLTGRLHEGQLEISGMSFPAADGR
jgi:hypothetical protein